MRQTRWKNLDAFLAELRSGPRQVRLGSQCLRSALDLVRVADDARRFTSAVNRVLGEDTGRWRLAASLDQSALSRVPDGSAPVPALIDTTVALYMAGNLSAAMAFELRARGAGERDPQAPSGLPEARWRAESRPAPRAGSKPIAELPGLLLRPPAPAPGRSGLKLTAQAR